MTEEIEEQPKPKLVVVCNHCHEHPVDEVADHCACKAEVCLQCAMWSRDELGCILCEYCKKIYSTTKCNSCQRKMCRDCKSTHAVPCLVLVHQRL